MPSENWGQLPSNELFIMLIRSIRHHAIPVSLPRSLDGWTIAKRTLTTLIHILHQFNGNEPLKSARCAGSREIMTKKNTKVLNALSQPNRLALFEAIAGADEGLTTTEAAKAAGTLLNTAAVNLTVLEAAGLISSEKSGRSVTHTAKIQTVRKLADYLNAIGR